MFNFEKLKDLKKFEVSAYGVEELSGQEARTVNGGILLLLASAYAGYKFWSFVVDSLEGVYQAGYDAGYNSQQ